MDPAKDLSGQFEVWRSTPQQIRMRENIGWCMGLKIPKDEEDMVAVGLTQKNFDDNAPLILQYCQVATLPQYFTFNTEAEIMSGKDTRYRLAVVDAEASGEPPQGKRAVEGGGLQMKQCTEGCENINSAFTFTDEGFLVHKFSKNMILQPKDGKLWDGTPIVTAACGTANFGGTLKQCPNRTYAQFDLLPLFTVVKGKQAVNCAPYSHKHPDSISSIEVQDEAHAQRICAADPSCKVYMYVSKDAEDAPERDKGRAWFCTALDVVYSGKEGYQLGFRALDDNEELAKLEAAKLKTWASSYEL